MLSNNSPWLAQLKRTRPVDRLVGDLTTDVAIVGGGIAGVSTAYFVLKHTDKAVALLEADKIAHGATGHNAGQLVSYFERPFADIVKEFGLEQAAKAQEAIESAWVLLEEIHQEAQLQTPIYQFTGYAGCSDLDEILAHLENNAYRIKVGLVPYLIAIADNAPCLNQVPHEYKPLYTVLPQKDILALLETEDPRYIAALSARKGCMNSALFCEELIGYLLTKFQGRFVLAEHAPVAKITLEKDSAMLDIDGKLVTAECVVLCTNGFEKITIINNHGKEVDTKFHALVRGSVGYMVGYLEELDKPPTAISYLPSHNNTVKPYDADPYFYLSRRPYEVEKNQKHNLVSVGGPEVLVGDTKGYSKESAYDERFDKVIDEFIHRTYKHAPQSSINYTFRWHGLMGYTPNGIRLIGPEPRNPRLLYNLGCNGIGLLPSMYGGKRIAHIVAGEKVEPMIFDVRVDDTVSKYYATPDTVHS